MSLVANVVCGENPSAAVPCVSQGHLHAVWALLHAGFPTTDIDEVGNNTLMLACTAGHVPIVAAIASGGCECAYESCLCMTKAACCPSIS